MRVLHLTLKKKWFDMIASGEKKEEYRETKPYWLRRLQEMEIRGSNNSVSHLVPVGFRTFDVILFRNGYQKNAPTLIIECKGISVGSPNSAWSDSGAECHIIKLGSILPSDFLTGAEVRK